MNPNTRRRQPLPLWTAAEAALATQGAATGDWAAKGVSIDTRTLKPGDLFVAIRGVAADGHTYAAQALQKGAAAVVVDRGFAAIPGDAPCLRVADTTQALEALGRAARARSKARVVAVTGSVGKTGTKDALFSVLDRHGQAHATQGNLNNHWGLPLTLARLPREADFAVLEMGMNHAGEITPLSMMGRPHVALITTVEQVHSEFFSSIEKIADAKAEIFAGIEAPGWAVLNRDNRMFDRLSAAARAANVGGILSFGAGEGADVRLVDARPDARGTSVIADIAGERHHYRVGVPGRHWVMNTLGVLGVCRVLGLDMELSTAMLARLTPPKGRGDRVEVHLAGGLLTLIDETYNASPAAMAAAIDVLGMSEPGANGRRIAVLGDMLELGEGAAAAHRGLAKLLASRRIDLVFTAGPNMGLLFEDLPREMRGGHAESSDKLAPMTAAAARAGDTVLVKGSYGMRMGKVLDALMAKRDGNGGHGKAANGE